MKKIKTPAQVNPKDSTPGITLEVVERFARIYRLSKPKDIKRAEIEINGYLTTYDIDRMTKVDGYIMLMTFKLRETPKETPIPLHPEAPHIIESDKIELPIEDYMELEKYVQIPTSSEDLAYQDRDKFVDWINAFPERILVFKGFYPKDHLSKPTNFRGIAGMWSLYRADS